MREMALDIGNKRHTIFGVKLKHDFKLYHFTEMPSYKSLVFKHMTMVDGRHHCTDVVRTIT